ncbi:MAG: SdrD B-like domain-containing protein, partial [Planctomycetota bacterium]
MTVNVLPIAQAASIGNRVWQDANEDGLQDGGESGVAGVVVEAYSTDDGVLRGTAITDVNGMYAVGGLLPGVTYYAEVRPPVGYSFTDADAGSDDAIDSDADALGKTPSVTVAVGEVVDSLDAGLIGSQPYFGFASTIATTGDDRALAIATDAAGNIYLAGLFRNTADFDPGPGVFEMTGQGTGQAFVAKYTATGAFVWAKSMGGTSFDQATALVVAADGSVVVAGSFQGTADFDPGSGEHLLTSKGSTDAFVAKLDSSGRLLWAHQAGSTSSDYAYGLAGAADGSVYVAGYFRNTVDFDPGSETFNLVSSNNDAFVWKLDSQGEFNWAARLGGTSSDLGYSIAVAPSGNVVTIGSFQGTADMDPGAGVSNLTSAGSADVFVSVLDETGAFVWARRLGGTGFDQAYAAAVATDGSVFTAGKFSNTVDFDPGAGTFDLTSAGGYDAFVSKLDPNGDFAWASTWGGPSSDDVQGIAVSPDGSVQATGSFYNTIDFDPGPGAVERAAVGSSDVFVSRLNATGGLQWVQTFGGTSTDVGYGVLAAADGSVYTTGKVVGTTDFDPRSGEYAIAGGGGQDVFLSRLLPLQAPTGLSLAQDRVLEQQPVNTTVGNLVASDPEPGETFVFELVSGPGDDDNASFALDGNPLRTQAVFDHSVKQTYSIRVRAIDSAGLSFEQTLTVSVVDLAQAGSIGDLVWDDQNGNGIQDVGETGVEGVGVEAFSSVDGLSRGTSVTDANGNYTISTLLPDLDYQLQFRPPVGFDFTGTDVGVDDALDSDTDATGLTSAASVSAGANLVDVDAGLIGAAPWFGFALGAGAPSTASNVEDRGRAVVTDAAGNMYVTGSFQETVDFDPGPGVYELTSQGSLDAVVAKYAPGGALIWAASFGGLNGVIGTALTLAPNGDVLVAGEYSGTADFRPGGGRELLTSAGGYDAFVSRLDPQGHLVWARSVGGTSNDRATGVATSSDGSVVVTGYFAGTSD